LDGNACVGGSERVGIGLGWFVGRGEICGATGFDQVAFVIGAGVVKVFKRPMTGIDAALEERLD
jgi:hypothetical protein